MLSARGVRATKTKFVKICQKLIEFHFSFTFSFTYFAFRLVGIQKRYWWKSTILGYSWLSVVPSKTFRLSVVHLAGLNLVGKKKLLLLMLLIEFLVQLKKAGPHNFLGTDE